MKPIVIREENKQIIMSTEEFKKTIQEVYEGGVVDGKLQERSNTYHFTSTIPDSTTTPWSPNQPYIACKLKGE